MTLDTHMTVARSTAEAADGTLGIEELGKNVAGEVEAELMVPLLV